MRDTIEVWGGPRRQREWGVPVDTAFSQALGKGQPKSAQGLEQGHTVKCLASEH